MFVLFRRRLWDFVVKNHDKVRWYHAFLTVLIHWLTSWGLIAWFEPNAEFVQADTYWWYYLVTVTTVGYGDFSPTDFWARMVAAYYVMLPGIAMMGVVIGKIAAVVVDTADKIRRGMMTLDIEDHSIVVGDGSEHTLALLRNLIADPSVGGVVLVSAREENPMNGALAGFVSGDINDELVQRRACFRTARRVIVLGSDDTTVTGRTIAVMDCAGPETKIIAYLQHETAARRLNAQTDDRVRTVSSVSMDLVVQEALDPGAAAFIKELLRNGEGGTYVRCLLPEGVETTWAQLGAVLMSCDLNPLCLYVDGSPVAMPKGKHPVKAGDCIGVAAGSRIDLEKIDWSLLQ